MANRVKVEFALLANKEHQVHVKSYIETLEAELALADDLLDVANIDPEEGQESSEFGIIDIPGASKPTSLILQSGLLSEISPFYDDAKWRETYECMTTLNPMKGKEQEALRKAVRIENQRIATLAAQSTSSTVPEHAPAFYEKNREGLDWNRIANTISETMQSMSKRKPEECEIRWLGYLHPDINKSPWTSKELNDLRVLLDGFGDDDPVDWVEISQKLGTGRSPIDCMCHGAERKVHTWNSESDKRLLDCIRTYGENNWTLVAMSVSEHATVHQCQKRYYETLDPNLKRGPWDDEEDEKLLRAVAAFSTTAEGSSAPTISWPDVALFVPGRTNNQCREHYQSKFKVKEKEKATTAAAAKIKGWSEELDAKLREAVAACEEGQWREVSELVGGGKTDKMCQKRFTALRKEERAAEGSKTQSEADVPPTKRARKPTTSKPRAKKAKSVEASEEQSAEENGSTADASVEAKPPPKRRARPQPGKFKKGQRGADMFGEVQKGAESGGSGSVFIVETGVQDVQPSKTGDQAISSTVVRTDEPAPDLTNTSDAMQVDENPPAEQGKKRGRLSAKARGKQKAVVQENPTEDPSSDNEQAEPDDSTTTVAAATQKKRTRRQPKTKSTDQTSTTPEPNAETVATPQAGGLEGVTSTSTETPMEVDEEPEPSNRRRSARLKCAKK
ncbi:hypothetical protein SCHPADRAFT_997861 [Schizopora paradoxa]|uniref:Uncharacterized protein n=1 Tax=Schizopora paradoxa TaxID=27342 RepID=A0A0H2RMM9_9AGAM|nr:hypothetical protein SCHPADRAFT_997861 [Schizopora paradoxa]